jgi:tetratricopeptide (TPR) repeat protein
LLPEVAEMPALVVSLGIQVLELSNSLSASGVKGDECVVQAGDAMKIFARNSVRLVSYKAAGLFLILFLLLISAREVPAQQEDSYQARRAEALRLYDSNKFVDALALLQKLHEENSTDTVVLERLSFATLAHSATLEDAAARKSERAKAKKLALEAKAQGDNSNLLKVVLEVPDDGGEEAVSGSAAVQAVMQKAEAAFANGDFDAALAAYAQALALDPHEYNAALFSGDVYFKKGDHEQADKWFLRAIEINPNYETAYRYWGDDLVAQGKMDEAKEKFISAIVAEPYNRRSWIGLSQWAQRQKMVLSHPRIDPPGRIEDKGKNQTSIIIDPSTLDAAKKKDGTDAWFIYTLARAVWHGDKFHQQFPQETEYRHSLPEEVDGLQAVVSQVREKQQKKEIKQLDPALATLVKLSDEELLEPFVLISRADQGIAHDYAAYRDAHREKVRQYIVEWVLHPAP